jgi:hypothetical protein
MIIYLLIHYGRTRQFSAKSVSGNKVVFSKVYVYGVCGVWMKCEYGGFVLTGNTEVLERNLSLWYFVRQ